MLGVLFILNVTEYDGNVPYSLVLVLSFMVTDMFF